MTDLPAATETTAPTVNAFVKPFAKVARDLGAAEKRVRGLMRTTIGYAALAGKARQIEAILDATDVAESTKRTIKATAARIRDFIDDDHAEPLDPVHAPDRAKVDEWVNAIMHKVGASNDAECAGKLRDYRPPADPTTVAPEAEAEPTAETPPSEGKPLDAQPSPNRVAIPAKADQPTISAAEPTLAEQTTAYVVAMSPDTRREWLVALFAKLDRDEVETILEAVIEAPIQTEERAAA